MKNSHKQLSVPLLALICLFAGCAQTQKQGPTGFPVRVGIQDSNGLPVELLTNKPVPVEARLKVDEKIPVELVIEQNKPLPVKAEIQADQTLPVKAQIRSEETLPVKLIPDRAIWIMVAIACLMAFFTMVSAVASCRAAINAKRAAEKR